MPLECLELSQPVSYLHPFESYALSFNNSLVAIVETWLNICEITPSCAGMYIYVANIGSSGEVA